MARTLRNQAKLSPKMVKKLNELGQLANHYMAVGDVDKALAVALEEHKVLPSSPVALDRAASICVLAHRYEEAVQYAKKALARNPKLINALHALSHAAYRVGDYAAAREAGHQALQLLESSLGALEIPLLPEVQLKENAKNVIAFSLFGDSPKYLEGAAMNTELAAIHYPDWVCRFYVDEGVPESALQRLAKNGAEIVQVGETEKELPKTCWRFLAADDDEVNYVIFRDADSVVSQAEADLVQAWLQSGKRFHTIRDGGSHTELILAGLWGMVAGSVPDLRAKLEAFVAKGNLDQRFADQHFLRQEVWKYVRQDLFASDGVFGFGEDVHCFDKGYRNEFDIGACEVEAKYHVNDLNYPDGTKIVWRLYTKVARTLSAQGTIQLEEEERLVCEYPAVIQNGGFVALLPKRYAQGFAKGCSRMSLQVV